MCGVDEYNCKSVRSKIHQGDLMVQARFDPCGPCNYAYVSAASTYEVGILSQVLEGSNTRNWLAIRPSVFLQILHM